MFYSANDTSLLIVRHIDCGDAHACRCRETVLAHHEETKTKWNEWHDDEMTKQKDELTQEYQQQLDAIKSVSLAVFLKSAT